METPNLTITPLGEKPHTIVKWSFVLGIMLLTNLFVAYLVQALYPAPEYETYCSREITQKIVETADTCVAMGGSWYADQAGMNPNGGYCDVTRECQEKYDDDRGLHDRNVFVVFVIFGAALLIASLYLSLAEVVALGLSFGGVLALVIGSVWHWSTMQEWLRVIVLGVALIGVVSAAAKKFKA